MVALETKLKGHIQPFPNSRQHLKPRYSSQTQLFPGKLKRDGGNYQKHKNEAFQSMALSLSPGQLTVSQPFLML